ncbi:MAG: hypothetical protein H0W86_02395 [Armatimonadetes bacterium]|nr:hypothetical protein [Armatimonadota bacterium]
MQIKPIGAMPLAFSADGERMILGHGLTSDRATVEVRNVDTDEVLYTQRPLKDSYPAMFRHDLLALYCVAPDAIIEMSLETGETRKLIEVEKPAAISHNFDQTITVFWSEQGFMALNSQGEILRSSRQPLFDQYGDAWTRAKDGWTKLGRSGRPVSQQSRPAYLVEDQSLLRGRMKLFTDQKDFERRGATAYISTIWLDHARARGSSRSALVFAGPDVNEMGFVPRRDMVWVASADGGYLVSWKMGAKQ